VSHRFSPGASINTGARDLFVFFLHKLVITKECRRFILKSEYLNIIVYYPSIAIVYGQKPQQQN
jgi:hypothetical protein